MVFYRACFQGFYRVLHKVLYKRYFVVSSMKSIRYIEVVFYEVVVKLFFLVLVFLHMNPSPKSYNSTSLLRPWAPPGFPYFKTLSLGSGVL